MPKKVDHQQRRTDIAAAVGRIAREQGLQGVSFREVAAEAGVSVSLVQHYFGTKENLLIGTLDIHSARLGELIVDRLGSLGSDAGPLDRLRVVASSFLPVDDERRDAMLLYHGFAAVALTEPALRRAEAFRNADALLDVLAGELRLAGVTGADADIEALEILSLVLGLSLGVLLQRVTPAEADAVLDGHLARLIETT
jgi:AcrR family transcriptional regulator